VDGSTELIDNGDWTIDLKTGTIYVKNPPGLFHPAGATVFCTYCTADYYDLDLADWDFVDGKLNEVQVYDHGYFATAGSETVTASVRSVDISGVHGMVFKSVRLSEGLFGAGYQPYEVPFIDGEKEFNSSIGLQDEEIPQVSFSDIGAGLRVASWRITHYETVSSSGGLYISNNSGSFDFPYTGYKVFIDGASEFDATGQWTINWTTGYIYLCEDTLTVVPSGETVSYEYEDLFSAERLTGAFSVNYKEGIIYFAIPTVTSGTIEYRFAPYYIRYNISIPLEEGKHYSLSYPNQRVTIMSDGGKLIGDKIAIYYRFRETESKIKELAPYFSPLVRGVAIKAV
jgi:hypothetical protein